MLKIMTTIFFRFEDIFINFYLDSTIASNLIRKFCKIQFNEYFNATKFSNVFENILIFS